MYSYLTYDDCVDKNAKGTKKYVTKRKTKFEDYKTCLEKNESILKIEQRFRSKAHNVFKENVNKISVTANDDKILQTCDRVI